MLRTLRLTLLAVVGLLAPAATASAQPDPTDTRLLTHARRRARRTSPSSTPKTCGSPTSTARTRDGSPPTSASRSHPVFSPDGQTIAFSAQYDGNTDVYTIPVAGGAPTRLTWHPGAGHRPRLHPGRQARPVLLAAARVSATGTRNSSPCRSTGGMPTQLPIPWGFEAELLARRRVHRLHARSATPPRSGSTTAAARTRRIWIYNVKTHDVVEIPQPKDRCNDLDPNWVGDTRLLPLRPRRRVQRVRLRRRRRRT